MGGLCSRRAPPSADRSPYRTPQHQCAKCGRPATTRCSKCKSDWYCSKECQTAHWRVHKEVCGTLAGRQPSSSSQAAADAYSSGPQLTRTPLCGQGYLNWLEAHATNGLGFRSTRYLVNYMPEEPRVGFTNWTNNCYLNAVYQCLLATPMLRQHLLTACPYPEDKWLAELAQLYRTVDDARVKGIGFVDPPRKLSRLIAEANDEFILGRQADAHEALMLLIQRWLLGCLYSGDGSGADLMKLGYGEKERLEVASLIGHVFAMSMGQTISCDSCSYESSVERVEYCLCLSVTMGMTAEELQRCRQESAAQLHWYMYRPVGGGYHHGASESVASPTSLLGLFREYTKKEHIPDYKCEKCKCSGATRQAYFRRPPNILMVYVDRRQDSQLFGKINRRVTFEDELELGDWLPGGCHSRWRNAKGGSAVYRLYGMVVHCDLRGSTASGHYIAYVRDKRGNWYQVDDAVSRPVGWNEVMRQHPYMLFYFSETLIPPLILPPPKKPEKEETATESTSAASSAASTGTGTTGNSESSVGTESTDTAHEANRDEVEKCKLLARDACSAGDLDKATRVLQKARRMAPNDPIVAGMLERVLQVVSTIQSDEESDSEKEARYAAERAADREEERAAELAAQQAREARRAQQERERRSGEETRRSSSAQTDDDVAAEVPAPVEQAAEEEQAAQKTCRSSSVQTEDDWESPAPTSASAAAAPSPDSDSAEHPAAEEQAARPTRREAPLLALAATLAATPPHSSEVEDQTAEQPTAQEVSCEVQTDADGPANDPAREAQGHGENQDQEYAQEGREHADGSPEPAAIEEATASSTAAFATSTLEPVAVAEAPALETDATASTGTEPMAAAETQQPPDTATTPQAVADASMSETQQPADVTGGRAPAQTTDQPTDEGTEHAGIEQARKAKHEQPTADGAEPAVPSTEQSVDDSTAAQVSKTEESADVSTETPVPMSEQRADDGTEAPPSQVEQPSDGCTEVAASPGQQPPEGSTEAHVSKTNLPDEDDTEAPPLQVGQPADVSNEVAASPARPAAEGSLEADVSKTNLPDENGTEAPSSQVEQPSNLPDEDGTEAPSSQVGQPPHDCIEVAASPDQQPTEGSTEADASKANLPHDAGTEAPVSPSAQPTDDSIEIIESKTEQAVDDGAEGAALNTGPTDQCTEADVPKTGGPTDETAKDVAPVQDAGSRTEPPDEGNSEPAEDSAESAAVTQPRRAETEQPGDDGNELSAAAQASGMQTEQQAPDVQTQHPADDAT